jgi:hypothetical protein
MAYAKLSPQSINLLLAIRPMEAATPDEVKGIRKEIFASAKALFGIPADHALKVDIDTPGATFGVLVRKKGGAVYPLHADGQWIGAARAPVAPPPAVKRWFAVDTGAIIGQVQCDSDFHEGSVDAPNRAPVDTRFTANGLEFILDTDGKLFIQLGDTGF